MNSTGKHVAPGDRSLTISVAAHLAVAVTLIVAVIASLSGFVGLFRSDSAPVILDLGSSGQAGDATEVEPPDDAPLPAAEEAEPEPAEEPAGDDGRDDPQDAADEPAAERADDDGEADDDGPSAAEQRRLAALDPGDITIQVLDGAGDGGSSADALVEQLREDGFRIVAHQRAVSTASRSRVYYSPDAEDEARKVASSSDALGVIEPKPSSLSDSVMVHIVVGPDA